MTQDTFEGDELTSLTLQKYLFANADPIQIDDPTGHAGRIFNTAFREGTFEIGRIMSSLASRQSVRLIGCAFSLAMLGVCTEVLYEQMLPFRHLPAGGGINISVGVGLKEVGGAVRDAQTVIAVYHKNPLPPAAREALEKLQNETTKVVFSSKMHAERLAAQTIQLGGRIVSSLTTAWNMCDASKQNCRAVFGTVAGAIVKNVGRCIYEHFPIIP